MVVFSFSNVFGPFSKNRNPGKKYVRDNGPDGVLEKKKKIGKRGESKNYPSAARTTESSPLTNYICTGTSIVDLPFGTWQYNLINVLNEGSILARKTTSF